MIQYPTQLALQDRGLARLDLSTVSVALGICKWFNVLHPPGARVMICEPAIPTWANKATSGFYLGPALSYYRCSRIYNPEIGHERISSCLHVFSKKLRLLGSSRADSFEKALATAINTNFDSKDLIEAAKQLLTAIQRHPLAATVILKQDTTPIQRVQANASPVQMVQPRVLRSNVVEPHERGILTPATPLPPFTPDRNTLHTQRVQYLCEPYDITKMKPALRNTATALIGKSFIDEEEKETYQIIGIKERKTTPYFKYYNVRSYPQGPPQDEDHEYQLVSELLYMPRGQTQYKLRPPTKVQKYRFLNSISAGIYVDKGLVNASVKNRHINSIFYSRIDQPLLNVNPKGGELMFNGAVKGPDRSLWFQASNLETRRLMNSYTIKATHPGKQPHNRRCDL